MHNLFLHGFSEHNGTGVVKSIAEKTFKLDQFFWKEKSSWNENLLKWTLFLKEKSSSIKDLLEINLIDKYIQNLHLLERNFVGRNWKVTRTYLLKPLQIKKGQKEQSFSKSGTSNFFGPSYFEAALVLEIFWINRRVQRIILIE